jgi:DNA mismatch endonuclease (patch repair protein)
LGNILDDMTPAQRKKNMQHIRSKDTEAEILLRKALWRKGLRYRKNVNHLPGKPDIVFTKHKIVIFVDGDFWHARGHEKNPGEQIDTNKSYWITKLKRNVARDRYVNELLLEQGWLVLRFWESDIKNNLDSCVEEIMKYF